MLNWRSWLVVARKFFRIFFAVILASYRKEFILVQQGDENNNLTVNAVINGVKILFCNSYGHKQLIAYMDGFPSEGYDIKLDGDSFLLYKDGQFIRKL